jgi:hypothetical protein
MHDAEFKFCRCPDVATTPRGSTSSGNTMASSCMPDIIWEYVSMVKATLACPRASEITLGLAPLINTSGWETEGPN